MTPGRKASAAQMLRNLRRDITDDVQRREGMAFTGENVAAALGEMCAQIDALAAVLIALLEDEDGEK